MNDLIYELYLTVAAAALITFLYQTKKRRWW